MKKKFIITEAKQVKEYVEKNKRLPKTCTIDDKIYSIFSTSYLCGLLIRSEFKDVDYKLSDVILYNVTPPKDTINENVLKDDYLKMIVSHFKCKHKRTA